MQRRHFMRMAMAAATASAATEALAKESSAAWLSLIDLDRCDGCLGRDTPACVAACRSKNAARFPEPQKPLMPYWPQTKYEDYSDRRDDLSRLTPYNWLFIETVHLNGRAIHIPRRCMHCDHPSCQKLCPFGTIGKTAEGAVVIDHNYCFGGAKCRDVCPWHIPQRQAGVGLYLELAPKFAGGGLMFKCDFCADRLQKGELPACSQACPRDAMIFAPKSALISQLDSIVGNRYVYGHAENGGTATLYVSSTDFAQIDRALEAKFDGKEPVGHPNMKPKIANRMGESELLAKATLAAPVAAAIGAGLFAIKNRKPKE